MAEAWDEELRARGYRVTPQRQLVLAAVSDLEHATPEEIWATVQRTASGVNISTIYRTLELLENLGLVTHSHLGHGAPRYHLATEAEHAHLVCSRCGRITEVSPAALAGLVARLRGEFGFATEVGHLTFFGTCVTCPEDPGVSGGAAGRGVPAGADDAAAPERGPGRAHAEPTA